MVPLFHGSMVVWKTMKQFSHEAIMKNYLRQFGLIDTLRIELPISKAEFVGILKKNIDTHTNFFEAFSSSKNIYKGSVNASGFELKRRKRPFDTKYHAATAKGSFTQLGDTLRIDIEINGFSTAMMVFYLLGLLIYSFFIVFILFVNNSPGVDEIPGFILPFILLHAALMFTIPYFVLKRGVKRMKHNLEREIYFMTKK
jgi:hypothetical protein